MLIRSERPRDAEQIDRVHRAAFPTETEAALVAELRATATVLPELCFVATVGDEVVGHVCCSRGAVGDRAGVAIGPVAVSPARQGDGIGSALMHAAIGAADARNEPFIALLGDPAFYGRFGFVPAHRLGIEAPDPAWADAFQVRTLASFDPSIRGRFSYPAAFGVA